MKLLTPGSDGQIVNTTRRLLTVDEPSTKAFVSGIMFESTCWRYSLPFGAGAIWDCYRGFELRGGAAGGQRRPRGGTGNQDTCSGRHAPPLAVGRIALHHRAPPPPPRRQAASEAARRGALGGGLAGAHGRRRTARGGNGGARRHSLHRARGVSGALKTCNWLPGG